MTVRVPGLYTAKLYDSLTGDIKEQGKKEKALCLVLIDLANR